jgi:hypothetical protein
MTNLTFEELYGDPISTYTRAQAIEDGVLIDAGKAAKEVGFNWPVGFTMAAWDDCVKWTQADTRAQVYQDQSGRLRDVLYLASLRARRAGKDISQAFFDVDRVARDGKAQQATPITLKLVVGPGDDFEPVITIMDENED